MELRSLIESLQRLYLDPRVGPTTEVRVEMEIEKHFHDYDEDDNGICHAPLAAIAIDNSSSRSIVLSALPRHDAFAR